MPGGHQQKDLFRYQWYAGDTRLFDGRRGDTEIDLASLQLLHHRCQGMLLEEAKAHPWMASQERAQQIRQKLRTCDRQRDRARLQARQVGHLAFALVQFKKGPLNPPEKGPAELVQLNAPPLPVKERHPQFLLQFRDGLTQRWLRERELLSRPRHMFKPRGHLEIFKLQKIHRKALPSLYLLKA